jgi:hypothetical protein
MFKECKKKPIFPIGSKVTCLYYGDEILEVKDITQLCCGGCEFIYEMAGKPTLAFSERHLKGIARKRKV